MAYKSIREVMAQNNLVTAAAAFTVTTSDSTAAAATVGRVSGEILDFALKLVHLFYWFQN